MVKVSAHMKQSGTKVQAHTRMPPGSMDSGEFIAPDVSPTARKFINAARTLMYSDGLSGALQHAIHGAQYLSDGAVPFLSMLIGALEQKIGTLNDVDLHAVVVHLAGSVCDLAEKMGDPDTRNKTAAVQDIVEGVMAALSGQLSAMMQQAQGQSGQPPVEPDADDAAGMGGPAPNQSMPLLASAQ